MDILFLCVVIFLFLLAVFDLAVGVGNDAVNFLNSAIGSGAASFKRVLIVASAGVFIGAAMSNGMMDIARHGIFRPEHFSFYDLICIFMAVMVTDIILLDLFNTLGMPTSTTVSMVFELLGATFVVALIMMAGGEDLGFNDLLNTEKALSVILGIFLSVAIAFVFGTVVQFISRMIFSFNYKSHLTWKIGLFGGCCATAIIYFILIKGAKELTFMTPEVKAWINSHIGLLIPACFLFFTALMQLLHFLKVNVLKVVVMMGTFALAMAFAGNDLVNFIGVPLSGLSSYQDYVANGSGDPHTFMMNSLNGPSNTPVYFLIGAGVVMVTSLATSAKVRNVTKTAISLSSQQAGDEMFGSSRLARRLVRWVISAVACIRRILPESVLRWFGRRFNTDESIIADGAAFDLVRGSVNLVLAGALIALGTSMKLPLSTTFVTFMVAMGTSLADRAWGRESAVFRITGVISVIGGWFVTAAVAFVGAGIIVAAMHYGGHWVIFALGALTIFLIIRSNRRLSGKQAGDEGDVMFNAILTTTDKDRIWPMLQIYVWGHWENFISYAGEEFERISSAFVSENVRELDRTERSLLKRKQIQKNFRRKETLCLRSVPRAQALEKSAWFHMGNDCCMSMLYNLRRINEICREHVGNNFLPLPETDAEEFKSVQTVVAGLFNDTVAMMHSGTVENVGELRHRCDEAKDLISAIYHRLPDRLHEGDVSAMSVMYVYLNMLQEAREMVSGLRKILRACGKMA